MTFIGQFLGQVSLVIFPDKSSLDEYYHFPDDLLDSIVLLDRDYIEMENAIQHCYLMFQQGMGFLAR